MIGTDPVLEAMDKVQLIGHILKIAQIIQKSYKDEPIKEQEFQVDDWVFRNVSPVRSDAIGQERKDHS